MIDEKKALRPLYHLGKCTIYGLKCLSLSTYIIGRDPQNEGLLLKYFTSRGWESEYINYHTFVDFYILAWFTIEATIICSHPDGEFTQHMIPFTSISIDAIYITYIALIAAILRLIELTGSELYVAAYRAAHRRQDPRTMVRRLINYGEGILLFTIINLSVISLLVADNTEISKIINFNSKGLSWDTLTILYYSAINYTTTGFGDITPIHYKMKIIGGLTSVFGIFYLTMFISSLISSDNNPEGRILRRRNIRRRNN